MSAILYDYLWFFLIYAFIGWCAEVCFAAAKHGTFVNRGFLNGPVCPIYGFGVVIVVAALTPLKGNVFILFLGSVLLTSALEWVTGFVLEKLFHQKWWDYSDMPFNLNGYVCLLFSLIWGLACLLVMDIFHPMIAKGVHLIPRWLGIPLLCVFLALFVTDAVLTVFTMLKINRKLHKIDELSAKIKFISDGIGKNLSDGMLDIAEKSEDLQVKYAEKKEELEKLKQEKEAELKRSFFGQNRMLKAFPRLRIRRHEDALRQLKENVKTKLRKK